MAPPLKKTTRKNSFKQIRSLKQGALRARVKACTAHNKSGCECAGAVRAAVFAPADPPEFLKLVVAFMK